MKLIGIDIKFCFIFNTQCESCTKRIFDILMTLFVFIVNTVSVYLLFLLFSLLLFERRYSQDRLKSRLYLITVIPNKMKVKQQEFECRGLKFDSISLTEEKKKLLRRHDVDRFLFAWLFSSFFFSWNVNINNIFLCVHKKL